MRGESQNIPWRIPSHIRIQNQQIWLTYDRNRIGTNWWTTTAPRLLSLYLVYQNSLRIIAWTRKFLSEKCQERSHGSKIFSIAACRSSMRVLICQDPREIVFKIIGLITSSPSVTFMRTAKLVRWLHLQMEWVSLEEKVSKVHPFLDHMPLLFSPLGRNFKISSVHGWRKWLHSQIWLLMSVLQTKNSYLANFLDSPCFKIPPDAYRCKSRIWSVLQNYKSAKSKKLFFTSPFIHLIVIFQWFVI